MSAVGDARKRMAGARFFEAVDGENEPTIWERTENERRPMPVMRRCEIAHQYRDAMWPLIVKAVTSA